MTDEQKTDAPATESVKPFWGEMTGNFKIVKPQPVWVVKVGREYMRLPAVGGILGVVSVRLATRLDSELWAKSLALRVKGAKVVRLWTKAEREAEKAGGWSRYVWTRDGDGKRAEIRPPEEARPEAQPEAKTP